MNNRNSLFLITLLSISTISCTQSDRPMINTDTIQSYSENYSPGDEWKLVWADEFDGDSLNMDNWNRQVVPAGRFNDEWQRYTDSEENSYIEDGNLVIKAIHESDEHGMDQYTSARLNTAQKQNWKYGKIAARIKLPHGEGMWPAFWMLGSNIDENGGDTPWPQSGEIDILELYGSKDDASIEANFHYADENGDHAMLGQKHFKLKDGIFADNFHVFEIEWDAEKISWLVDGEEYASADITDDVYSEFHEEFFILLNIACGGTWSGRPDETTPFPQFMYVDWVRVYQKHNT